MKRSQASGFIIAPILLLVGLIAAVAVAMATLSRNSSNAQGYRDATTQITQQSSMVRQALVDCALIYPMGDNGTIGAKAYPAGATLSNVDDLLCPGAPSPNGLWVGRHGVFLPAVPSGTTGWKYINDATSVRIQLTATSTIAKAVLPGIATNLGSAASTAASGSDVVLTVMIRSNL